MKRLGVRPDSPFTDCTLCSLSISAPTSVVANGCSLRGACVLGCDTMVTASISTTRSESASVAPNDRMPAKASIPVSPVFLL